MGMGSTMFDLYLLLDIHLFQMLRDEQHPQHVVIRGQFFQFEEYGSQGTGWTPTYLALGPAYLRWATGPLGASWPSTNRYEFQMFARDSSFTQYSFNILSTKNFLFEAWNWWKASVVGLALIGFESPTENLRISKAKARRFGWPNARPWWERPPRAGAPRAPRATCTEATGGAQRRHKRMHQGKVWIRNDQNKIGTTLITMPPRLARLRHLWVLSFIHWPERDWRLWFLIVRNKAR